MNGTSPLAAVRNWLLGTVAQFAVVALGLYVYHEFFAPRPAPDKVQVAAEAELRAHVGAWAAISKALASGTLKPDGVAEALMTLKTPAAKALADAIGAAADPVAAYADVSKAQSGMLK